MTGDHKIIPIQHFDEYSRFTEWVCSVCKFRLIRLIGFSCEWMHGFRTVE